MGKIEKSDLAPFPRPFPAEILTMIIKQTDTKTQPVWLRASSDCFELAGKIIYAKIEIYGDRFKKLTKGCMDTMAGSEGKDGKVPGELKARLLTYVETITIKGHQCPTSSPRTMAQAASLMINLKQIILCPDFGITTMPALCRHSICPILAGLKAHSVTIHNIRRIGPRGDPPLYQFSPIFDNVKHATLFLPTTASFIGRGVSDTRKHGLLQYLAYPTRNLSSVRLLIGFNDGEIESMESALERATSLCKVSHLQDFLASVIALNPTEIEIYLFSNVEFPKPQDLDSFKQQLAAKVKKQHKDLLAKIKQPNEQQTLWTANYQVYDIEHYFAQPGLCNELERWVLSDWKRDMEWSRDYEERERLKASQEQAGKYGKRVNESDDLSNKTKHKPADMS